MKVVDAVAPLRVELDAARADRRTVGFVPTMGALHDGHMSLVRRARDERDVVCVSIFVNPTQFGPNEDLGAYPRPLDADLAACRSAGVDVVFVPAEAEVYPAGASTRVEVDGLTSRFEGEHRPGHFAGVALVVTKLFAAVGPCAAYFGEKDAQQLRVVRRLARDLLLPVDVVGCPTVREPDGLAMSSRNAYLDTGDRQRALCVSRALFAMRDELAAGQRDVTKLVAAGRAHLDVADDVDYLAVVDAETFEPLDEVDGPALAVTAVRIATTRLIDNVWLTDERQAPAPPHRKDGR